MINFNDPFVGQIIMYVFIVMLGIVALFGAYKITRPLDLDTKQKKTS